MKIHLDFYEDLINLDIKNCPKHETIYRRFDYNHTSSIRKSKINREDIKRVKKRILLMSILILSVFIC